MREGGNGTGNVAGNRPLRKRERETESKGEFLLFIYELFIRLVELSLSPSSLCSSPLSLPLSLASSIVLSTNANTNPRESERDDENGKKSGERA